MQPATPDRQSRNAADILSPRRLDQLRANGKQILDPQGAQGNNQDAASTYKRMMEQRVSSNPPAQAASRTAVDPREVEREAEITMNQRLHLVPCRWERSGWKYVERDPADHRFFQNPNRVNNFGITAEKKRFNSQRRDSHFMTTNKSAFATQTQGRDTTYGRHFVDGQAR